MSEKSSLPGTREDENNAAVPQDTYGEVSQSLAEEDLKGSY
jgi:hypothetical protein